MTSSIWPTPAYVPLFCFWRKRPSHGSRYTMVPLVALRAARIKWPPRRSVPFGYQPPRTNAGVVGESLVASIVSGAVPRSVLITVNPSEISGRIHVLSSRRLRQMRSPCLQRFGGNGPL